MSYSLRSEKKQNKTLALLEELEDTVPNSEDWILDERHLVVSLKLRRTILDSCSPTDIMDCFLSKSGTAYHIRLYDLSISQKILKNLLKRRGGNRSNPKNEFVYTAWTKWCNSVFEKHSKCSRERCAFIHLNEKVQIDLKGTIWNERKQSLSEFLELRSKQGLTNEFIRQDFPQWIKSVSKNKSNNKEKEDDCSSIEIKKSRENPNYVHTYRKYAAATVKTSKSRPMDDEEMTWQVKKKKDDCCGDSFGANNDFADLSEKDHKLVIKLNMELKSGAHCFAKSSENKDLKENPEPIEKEEEEVEVDETQFSDETGEETIATSESLTDGTDGSWMRQTVSTDLGINTTSAILDTGAMGIDLSELAKLLSTPGLISCCSDVSTQSQMPTPVQNVTNNQIVLDSNLQSMEQSANTCMNSCDGLSSFAVPGCSDTENNHCYQKECIMTGEVLNNFVETNRCAWEHLPAPNSFNDVDLCSEFTQYYYCPREINCLWRHYHRSHNDGFDDVTQYITITLINRYVQENRATYRPNVQHDFFQSFVQQSATPMPLASPHHPFGGCVQKDLNSTNMSLSYSPFENTGKSFVVDNYETESNTPKSIEHPWSQNQAACVNWEKIKKDQFETCWDFNTSTGCPRGPACRWKHQPFVMNGLSNDFSQSNDGSHDNVFFFETSC